MTELHTTHHRGSPCPTCSKILDVSTESTGAKAAPKENDLTICAYCYSVAQYNADLSLRPADLTGLSYEDLQKITYAKVVLRGINEQPNRDN